MGIDAPLPLPLSLFASGVPMLDAGAVFSREQLDDRCWVDLAPGWVSGGDELLARLAEELPWKQSRRLMWGNWVDEPRLTCGVSLDLASTPPILGELARALGAIRPRVPLVLLQPLPRRSRQRCVALGPRRSSPGLERPCGADGTARPLRGDRLTRWAASVHDATEGPSAAPWHARSGVDPALGRSPGDGRVMPARVGALGAQGAQRSPAHERHVPAPPTSGRPSRPVRMNTPSARAVTAPRCRISPRANTLRPSVRSIHASISTASPRGVDRS
jgi:hypothetical protein